MKFGRIEETRSDGTVETLYDTRKQEWQTEQARVPTFPNAAWRGIFADYSAAMERATEATDAFHCQSHSLRSPELRQD
jgi:hypothetical protein